MVPIIRATIPSQNERGCAASKSSYIDKSTVSLSVASVNDAKSFGLVFVGTFAFDGVTKFFPIPVEQTKE